MEAIEFQHGRPPGHWGKSLLCSVSSHDRANPFPCGYVDLHDPFCCVMHRVSFSNELSPLLTDKNDRVAAQRISPIDEAGKETIFRKKQKEFIRLLNQEREYLGLEPYRIMEE